MARLAEEILDDMLTSAIITWLIRKDNVASLGKGSDSQ
jgi:hypothetical protein